MSRHQIHIMMNKLNLQITFITILFFITSTLFLITLISSRHSLQVFTILSIMNIIHIVAFNRCMSNLVNEKLSLEKILQELNKNTNDEIDELLIQKMFERNAGKTEEDKNNDIKKGD